jgi:hypothetical protein
MPPPRFSFNMDLTSSVNAPLSKYTLMVANKDPILLGLLYTRSQGQKDLGPTLSIFGLQIGPNLLINGRTLMSDY